MPRKKKPEKNRYKNIVCMKVTDIELEILNQHAATAGLSRSEYLRKLFLEKEIHVHYEVVADMKILRELLGEYGKIGSNLNQIARYFNTGGERSLALLLENYNISVISQRGRYRYLHPDRDRRITEKALGTKYGREYLEKIFIHNGKGLQAEKGMSADHSPKMDYHKDPTAIFCYDTKLRLVVNLQTNVKAMQSEAYARKVKITNLQQMANTLIYLQEHGYDTRENLTVATSEAHKKLDDAQKRLHELNAEMKTLNAQIHYTGQYFASKTVYAEFLKSKRKKKYRSEHASEITAYEEARDWLQDFCPDGKMLSLKSLKSRKKEVQEMISSQKLTLQDLKGYCKELDTVSYNTDAILTRRAMEMEQIPEHSTAYHKSQKERNEEML